MKIRSKLAWTYIILLVIGIIAISAYSILTIRSFLLAEGVDQFEKDVMWLALSIENIEYNEDFDSKLNRHAELSGYEIAVYDADGLRFLAYPDSAFEEAVQYLPDDIMQDPEMLKNEAVILDLNSSDKLIAYIGISNSENPARYLRISQKKEQYYSVVSSIRYIIYGGMFFSIIAVIIVSVLFARYLARPIQQLNDAALDIARGNTYQKIDLKRDDEFGTLAASLNRMAKTLRADNEKLKSLNEKQNQFFADITHEVRNPLHTISGALEMIELENLPNEKKEKYIQNAQKQISRVARLFEDIKTLQRYDFDQSFINKKKINLQEVIEEVGTVYTPIAQQKGLELIIKEHKPVTVFADPDKMEQVMDNLISNAIKYTNTGTVEVGCILKEEVVEVYVEDTGPGIGKQHLERLFDRFYRTDKARSRDKGGTGLGLSVVKGILNAHQSEIKVQSSVGHGSRFYFQLPLFSK